MLFIAGYSVRHKKFNEQGKIVDVTMHHIKILWKDDRTSVYTKTFASTILERV